MTGTAVVLYGKFVLASLTYNNSMLTSKSAGLVRIQLGFSVTNVLGQ